jgi:hypothetical protein
MNERVVSHVAPVAPVARGSAGDPIAIPLRGEQCLLIAIVSRGKQRMNG